MGGKCPHRRVKKRRYSHKQFRRTKFELKGDDAVYDELQKSAVENKLLPVDEDLPGMGQYYCFHCDRYFANATVKDEHFKTKRHKKRLKLMAGPAPHTQLDADLAAGMGMPDNGPKLMSMIFFLVTINIKKGRSIIWFAHLLGCIIVGLMGLIVEIPLYTAISIVKSPYLLFKDCQTLIHDLISREGPFLKTTCIPIAGLTILMWPLIVIGSIIMAIFSSIFIGLYGSVIVYQEHSFRRGLAYVIAMVAKFDEYTNDWLYLREGSILPNPAAPTRPQYRKKILPSSDPSVVVQAMAPKQPNTGLFVGLNRGHIVTNKEFEPRPSDRKGKTSKRTIFVRNLIRENI